MDTAVRTPLGRRPGHRRRDRGRSDRRRSRRAALNGFGGNREMVERYLGPEAAAALYYGSPNNTGEA